MEGKGYKIKFISLVIAIFFLSSCKTIETVRTEYVKDSTIELFLKEQLEIKELQLAEVNKELKETYKEVTRLKAETNTSIEKYDTSRNVIERIIINRVESTDNSKEYNSELFESLYAEISYLTERNAELKEEINNKEINNKDIESLNPVIPFWKKLKFISIGLVLGFVLGFIIRLIRKYFII